MDNNFDENRSSAENDKTAEELRENTGGQLPEETNNITGENNMPYRDIPQENYPPNMAAGNFPPPYSPNVQAEQQYFPPNNGMYPPPPMPPAPKKRKLSNGAFAALLTAVIILFVIIVVLAAAIGFQVSRRDIITEKNNALDPEQNLITDKANHTVVELPTSKKPVIEDEFYADKETGLLTSVGVAKVILPSQVKIEIFDSMPYAPISSGSGIVITSDGYILTNAHVIDGAKSISVSFYDGSSLEAEFVGMDKKSDLAVIKVEGNGFTAAEIGESSDLVIGEEAAVAGAGGGFENTVTYGHITGLDRNIDTDYISSTTIHCIQTDAALNLGNSGGALVNMYGQVVGVAVALMNHETYENIGFVIAIDDAVPIAEELIANGYVSSRSRVGITYASIGDSAASSYGIMSGLCVMEIDPTCDIANTGIIPYDIITHINGVRVFGAEEVTEALSGKLPGDEVTFTVFRRAVTGENSIFEVTAELAPDTSSISGYAVTTDEDDPTSRDIIR